MRSLFLAVLAAAIGAAYAFPGQVKAHKRASVPQARRLGGVASTASHASAPQARRRRLGGDHGAEKPICGCEAQEEDHPFNMDCADVSAVNDAEAYLLEYCPAANMTNSWYEWAGVFDVPEDLYRWSSQPVGNPLAYADETMETMFFPRTARRRLETHDDEWDALIMQAKWSGDCVDVYSGDTITPMEGVCYKMIFNDTTVDSVFPIDTSAIDEMVVFAQHLPTEFERDRHYLYSTTNEDIEPKEPPGELSQQSTCGVVTDGVKKCQQAFYTIQGHHDYCPPGTITTSQSELMHVMEDYCVSCAVDRQYIEGAEACIKPLDCKSDSAAHDALDYLNAHCELNGPLGTCCRNQTEKTQYDILYAFHEFCGTDMSEVLENGMHHYEVACEPYICSTVTEPFDPMYCPPPEMTWQEEARAAGWAPCKKPAGSAVIPVMSRRLSAVPDESSPRMLSMADDEDD